MLASRNFLTHCIGKSSLLWYTENLRTQLIGKSSLLWYTENLRTQLVGKSSLLWYTENLRTQLVGKSSLLEYRENLCTQVVRKNFGTLRNGNFLSQLFQTWDSFLSTPSHRKSLNFPLCFFSTPCNGNFRYPFGTPSGRAHHTNFD